MGLREKIRGGEKRRIGEMFDGNKRKRNKMVIRAKREKV